MMHPRKFVISTILIFVGLCITYILILDFFIIPKEGHIQNNYKQFLLENTPGKRVIISSGSNSHYAIDSMILESYFKAPVINISDNAGYSFEHKIYNLMKYIHEGDIIIIPLEWSLYIQGDILSTNYVLSLFNKEIFFYYKSLPLKNKIQFMFKQMPLEIFLCELMNLFLKEDQNSLDNQLATAHQFNSRIVLNNTISRGTHDYSSDDKERINYDICRKISCDEYLFKEHASMGHAVSERFLKNLKLLQELQKKGVDIIFTPPTVVTFSDIPCYSKLNDKTFKEIFFQIKTVIREHGFIYAGDPQDSRFPKEYFYDTFYHITKKGTPILTNHLLMELIKAGKKPLNNPVHFEKYLKKVIDDKISELNYLVAGNLQCWDGQTLTAENFSSRINFTIGWSNKEKWGIWSEGKTSRLLFKLKMNDREKMERLDLKFKGRYYQGDEKTAVFVNNNYIGRYNLIDNTINIPGKYIKDNVITVTLNHEKPVSPYESEGIDDKRKLKYGLFTLTYTLL